MAEELRDVQKEIWKVREYLARIEERVMRVQMKMEPEEERVSKLKEELRKEYPDLEFTPRILRLLRLVGTQPYNPVSRDKEVIREAIADRYR